MMRSSTKGSSRREFLTESSAAMAGTLIGGLRPVIAWTDPRLSAYAVAPANRVAPDGLRQLALCAIDAARSAGATYADVRVGERHVLSVSPGQLNPGADVTSTLT